MAEFTPSALPPAIRNGLLTALVAPRPIAFVSTLSPAGVGNLAPFSFFMAGGYAPLSVCFSPVSWRDGSDKDSLRNVEATGEFVINIATADLAARLNQASYHYPPDVDEFEAVGLTRAPSAVVRPPRVLESPAALECRLFTVVRHGDQPSHANYVIGEVVHIHVDDEACTDGVPDNRKIEHLSRLGADWFSAIRPEQLFPVKRPTAP